MKQEKSPVHTDVNNNATVITTSTKTDTAVTVSSNDSLPDIPRITYHGIVQIHKKSETAH